MLLGLLDKNQQHLVTSVVERLPLAVQGRSERPGEDGSDSGDADDDEESVFVNPVPSGSVGGAKQLPTTSEARKRKSFSMSQRHVKRGYQTNTITRYYSSQKWLQGAVPLIRTFIGRY